MSHVTVFTMMVYQYEIIFQRITNNRTKNVYIMNMTCKKNDSFILMATNVFPGIHVSI